MVDMFTGISGVRNDETEVKIKTFQKAVTEEMALNHSKFKNMKIFVSDYLKLLIGLSPTTNSIVAPI